MSDSEKNRNSKGLEPFKTPEVPKIRRSKSMASREKRKSYDSLIRSQNNSKNVNLFSKIFYTFLL